ncbi:MAG: hypothetical protein OIF38_08935 [Cellvibrionaceae bacterium]|nr:hypothetical protein [Cellvibrionaceae bacterium]
MALPSATWAEAYLWLPASYKSQLPALQAAAEVAATNPRCLTLLKGTINVDHSTQEAPVFRFLCRDKNRKTFGFLLDGKSYKAFDPSDSRFHKGPSERSMREYWSSCQRAISDMYEDYRTIKILTKKRPKPILYQDATVGIAIDFDAISLIGEPLQFRAECIFNSGTSYRIKLTGRGLEE